VRCDFPDCNEESRPAELFCGPHLVQVGPLLSRATARCPKCGALATGGLRTHACAGAGIGAMGPEGLDQPAVEVVVGRG